MPRTPSPRSLWPRSSSALRHSLLIPLQGGASNGVAVTADEVEAAKAVYYGMAGWDENGRPTRGKLEELALGWAADELGL